jgi:hypothetical protein
LTLRANGRRLDRRALAAKRRLAIVFMDVSCAFGLCAALAQAPLDAGQAIVAPLASTTPATLAPQGGDALQDAGNFIFLVGALCVLLAQVLTVRVVRGYGSKMRRLMNESSQQAFGAPAPDSVQAWPADRVLRAIEAKRREMLWVLMGVVAVFSLSASALLVVASETDMRTALGLAYGVVSLLAFVALTGPVVLLGLSAAHFAQRYWTWFAPATLAAGALQGILISASDDEGAVPPDVAVALVLAALLIGAVLWGRHRLSRVSARIGAWRAAGRWRTAALVLGGLLAVVVVVGLSSVFPALARLAFGLLIGGVVVLVCHYTLVDRVRRIVAPLMAVGTFAAVFTGLLTFMALQASAPAFASWLGGSAAAAVALLAAGLVGNFVLSWIGLAYEQKVFSDAQFQIFSWMIGACAIVVLINTVTVGNSHLLDPVHLGLMGCTVLALAAYWALVRYGVAPLPTNRRLLVLRVFSAEHRGEQLMEELEERWRYIGPLMLIGGTDVAMRTIDPAKAANFMRRRLQDICVPNQFALHKRIAALDEQPDPDGRYRVNEFFCTNDLWQEAVAILLAYSDAIVLDLSEFTADRSGTTHELGLLKTTDALARTVFIVSERTDLDAVRAALKLPAGSPLPAGRVVQVERSHDGGLLVEALGQCLGPAAMPSPAAALLQNACAPTVVDAASRSA